MVYHLSGDCYSNYRDEQFGKIYGDFLKLCPDQSGIRELYDREYEEHAPAHVGLAGGETFEDDGFCLQVIATPGHSGDCLSFFEPEYKLLFAGDAVQGNGFDGNAPFYCDADAYLGSVVHLASLRPAGIYCGHGAVDGSAAAGAFLQQSIDAFHRLDEAVHRRWNVNETREGIRDIAQELGYNVGMHILTTAKAHIRRTTV